jgi:hypothetical protein
MHTTHGAGRVQEQGGRRTKSLSVGSYPLRTIDETNVDHNACDDHSGEPPPKSAGPTTSATGGQLFRRISRSLKDNKNNKADSSTNSLHYCDLVDSSCYNTSCEMDDCPHFHDAQKHDTYRVQDVEFAAHYVHVQPKH